ncbi:restriction endonuclease subunit S [Burkholderia sp. Ed8]|uniref:restriction endonuclease subunit S n=1 Tax=Burkholderia sp. Ed8 TaxID=3112957 RepID=UPI00345DB8ED
MQSEWRSGRLGDFIELKRGYDLPQAKRVKGTVPLVSSSGVSDSHNVSMVNGPGVVTGRYGTLGQVFYIEDDFWPLNTTLYVRDFKGNDPKYIRYFLSTFDFFAFSDKAAVPGVNRNHLHEARVTLPPVNVQRDIADVLGSLDDRIDLLRRTNATLESIARALFKSWFIDFDPVRVKAEGSEPEGMGAETAALFPDSFEDSKLGEIPKGWRVGTFGDLASLVKGSINPMTTPADTFEHYSLPAFDASQLPVFELGETIKSNKTRVPAGAVLQSKLNPHIPRVWFPSRVGDRAVCSTEFLPWVPKGTASEEVIYCTLSSPAFAASVRTLVTGTSNSHQRVKPDQVAALALVLAPGDVYDAFSRTVRALLAKVGEDRWTVKSLADLRDMLLPRLISGKLRLPEAEAQLNEALA